MAFSFAKIPNSNLRSSLQLPTLSNSNHVQNRINPKQNDLRIVYVDTSGSKVSQNTILKSFCFGLIQFWIWLGFRIVGNSKDDLK